MLSQHIGILFDMILVMKLRVRQNLIRLRLTRSEVERVENEGSVSESIIFGPGPDRHLTYSLVSDASIDAVESDFRDGTIVVKVPKNRALQWCRSDEVGIEARVPISDAAALNVLIEKDFACLKARPGEDESDAFPNPAVSGTC